MERMSTGNPNLDLILGGGIPVYSVNVICGPPGAGKTVLTQQMMFHNATPEHKALYLTTLSEPQIKVLRYQQQFTYFDPDKVGSAVFFYDIGSVVRQEGLTATTQTIVNFIKEVQPEFVAIDSFKAIHDLAPSPPELRQFVYDLAVKMAGWRCTTFLVGEYAPHQIQEEPEFAIADGVIQLEHLLEGDHPRRFLQVVKMRGTNYLDGKHSFDITADGLAIYPARLAAPPTRELEATYCVPYGVPELDSILGGGFPVGTHVVVAGPAGAGKTIFSLEYAINGALLYGDRAALFLFEETLSQIRALAQSFAWDLSRLEQENLLRLCYSPLTDINLDAYLQFMQSTIQELGVKRVVIDSLPAFLHPAGDDIHLVSEKISQLTAMLRALGCTTVSTTRLRPGSSNLSYYGVEEALADGLILLSTTPRGAQRKRTIEVHKLRGANPVMGEHRLQITSSGIRVFYTGRPPEPTSPEPPRNEENHLSP